MTPARNGSFRPSRRRGQNFLVDRGVLCQIVEAAQVPAGATVVEIGAGSGNLTAELLAADLRVIAVEVEAELSRRLSARFGELPTLRIVNADARRLDCAQLAGGPYHVVANLPYSVGTRVVVDLLKTPTPPLTLTVLLQREVAQRMTAASGKMGLLSVIVQSFASARRLFGVRPEAFRPRPKVHSALVRLEPRPLSSVERQRVLSRIAVARHGFAQPRKQLRNSLAAGLRQELRQTADLLIRAGVEPSRRPGTLELEEWDALADALQTESKSTVDLPDPVEA